MSEELNLLPCPVCGDTSVRIFYNDDNVASVGCLNCQFETRDFRREESAIRVWNSLPRRSDIERVEQERNWLAQQLEINGACPDAAAENCCMSCCESCINTRAAVWLKAAAKEATCPKN